MIPMSFTDAPAVGPAPSMPPDAAAPGAAPAHASAQGRAHAKAFAALIDNWLSDSLGSTPSAGSGDSSPSAAVKKNASDSTSSDTPSAGGADEDADGSLDPAAGGLLVVMPPAYAEAPWQSLGIQIPVPGDEDAETHADNASDAATDAGGTADVAIAHLGGRRAHRGHAAHAGQAGEAAGDRTEDGTELAELAQSSASDLVDAAAIAQPGAVAAPDGAGREHGEARADAGRVRANVNRQTAQALAAAARSSHADTSATTSKPNDLARPNASEPTSNDPAPLATGASPVSADRTPASTVEGVVRRAEPAMLTSMNTADARDAEERRGAQDAPPEERRPLAASARLAAAISGSAESHASAQAHDAAPVFAVPTAAASTASPSTANVEAPRETASAPHVDPQNVDRLVQSMHVNAKAGIMEATVRLRPEYLGEVTIHLRVDGTGVSAIVRAESAGVRQWLESQEESIRGGLAQHGLELGRFIVDPDDRQQAQQDAQQEAAEQRRAFARRRQAAMAQRFEVTA